MACLLYCVTLKNAESLSNLIGVAEQPVLLHDSESLRVYWSEVANPETLIEQASRKPAKLRYQQVLGEMAIRATAMAFPFPVVVTDLEAVHALVDGRRNYYVEALERLAGTVQYELTATWLEDERADLATPVSGREYLRRRQEMETRIASIDVKLRTVTFGIVREWRSRQNRRMHLWFALMERGDRDRFVKALRSAGASQGVRLRLSGPWPPTEFAPGQA